MTHLDEILSNILQILAEIEEFILVKRSIMDTKFLEDHLRSLNFESNDFFEKLTPQFDISNATLDLILDKLSNIVHNLDESLFEVKVTLLNLQIFLPIHLLFLLSATELGNQITQQERLAQLVSKINTFDSIPPFPKVSSIQEKYTLDNYLRILGSAGDLYYLLSSNLTLIKKDNLINWANSCFKQFYLLDTTLEKFDPLDFYSSNHLAVEDFYREIVGHYTILGNTNATNLLEYLLGVGNDDLLSEVRFDPYISSPTIQALTAKLQFKVKKIRSLLERVQESKTHNFYFSKTDQPMDIISFKLMMALEKYFTFTIAKIECYTKEYNQLQTPASTELKNALSLCDDWLETVLSLTEHNENILDTPFGGLFNSVFLEYLLLLALDDGKAIFDSKEKIFSLDAKLNRYKDIFVNDNHSFEQIADFLYYKTYAQIYVYSYFDDKTTLLELLDELKAIVQFFVNKPLLHLNAMLLILNLELKINNKSFTDLFDLIAEIESLLDPNFGISHLKNDIEIYLILLEKSVTDRTLITKLEPRIKPKILDINSWLIPNFNSLTNDHDSQELKFVSFNQFYDRIL